jgi:hypothetical protein
MRPECCALVQVQAPRFPGRAPRVSISRRKRQSFSGVALKVLSTKVCKPYQLAETRQHSRRSGLERLGPKHSEEQLTAASNTSEKQATRIGCFIYKTMTHAGFLFKEP